MTLRTYLLIGGGAFVGAILRYQLGLWAINLGFNPTTGFPWGTFFINVTGSFLLGLFMSSPSLAALPAPTRLLLTTGFCGGYTTFSTFSFELIVFFTTGQTL